MEVVIAFSLALLLVCWSFDFEDETQGEDQEAFENEIAKEECRFSAPDLAD